MDRVCVIIIIINTIITIIIISTDIGVVIMLIADGPGLIIFQLQARSAGDGLAALVGRGHQKS